MQLCLNSDSGLLLWRQCHWKQITHIKVTSLAYFWDFCEGSAAVDCLNPFARQFFWDRTCSTIYWQASQKLDYSWQHSCFSMTTHATHLKTKVYLTYIWNHLQQFNFNICYNWTKSVTFKTSQCQGWDFQKLSRRPQLSCRGSSVVSFKNSDKSFPVFLLFNVTVNISRSCKSMPRMKFKFPEVVNMSCQGRRQLSLKNLPTNNFRKTKVKEFCGSGISFRWVPLLLLNLTISSSSLLLKKLFTFHKRCFNHPM